MEAHLLGDSRCESDAEGKLRDKRGEIWGIWRRLDKHVLKLFRSNKDLIERILNTIWRYAEDIGEHVKIMNFCGTHEWTVTHYGIRELMPPNVELVAGPGCPVCVTPSHYIESAIRLSLQGVRVYTYGDAYQLPAVRAVKGARSLAEARAVGGDIKVVYSFLDAVKDVRGVKGESVFFGIGFETVAPGYALLFRNGEVPDDLRFMSLLKLTPPVAKYAVKLNLERGLLPLKGIIAPGHVSTVIGAVEWSFLPRDFGLSTVIAGFEPLDVLVAIAQILLMTKRGKPEINVEYRRVVRWDGNIYAKRLMGEVFKPMYSAWRGIGFIPRSGLKLRGDYWERYDALSHYSIPDLTPQEYIFTGAHYGVPWKHDLPPRCRCGEVVLGITYPTDCPLFMKGCKPDSPVGPCMVSVEGACNIWAKAGVEKG
jgi:hydrogenase expression/formation protein HypD